MNYFAFSEMHMKTKVEHFNDELPLKLKFIDNNVAIHVDSKNIMIVNIITFLKYFQKNICIKY